MKKIIYIFGFIMLTFQVEGQHNPLLSHYMLNSLPLNPAFSGSRDALSVALNYRKQWVGFAQSPTTASLSIHAPSKNSKIGYGFLFLNDFIGVSDQTGAMANFSYSFKTRKGKLSFGLAGGMINYRNSWTEINTNDPDDEVFNVGNESFWKPNFSSGLYYHTQKFYASISTPFMLEGTYANDSSTETVTFDGPSNLKIYMTSGYKIKGRGPFAIVPSFLVKYLKSSPLVLDLNLLIEYNDLLSVGATFRPNNAIIGILKYQITPKFTLGYGVDVAMNDISNYNKGSHEVSLIFDLMNKTNSKSAKFF